jgi:hypothetical protein
MASLRDPAARRLAGALAGASLLFVLLVLLGLVGRPLATDDLWWHLALGEVYARQGPWVPEDPLYHTTQGQPTVPHEWLFQVAVHGLQRALGFQGLRVAHALAVAGIALSAFAIFRRAAAAAAPAALATSVLLVLSWYRLFQWRPDLASVLALLALYVLLLERERPPGAARLCGALALFALWANLHSLFAIGLALLVAALLGVALERILLRACVRDAPPRSGAGLARPLALALLLAALASAVNPRGFEQHATFFVESASGDIWRLEDDFLPWNPLRPAQDRRALVPLCWLLADALLAACALTAAFGLRRLLRERSAAALRDFDALHLGLAAASLVAMLVAARFHWMAFFPLLYLLRALRRRSERDPACGPAAARAAAAAGLLLALAFPRGIQLDSYVREVAVEPAGYASPWLDQRYCGAGVRFLRDAGLEGRLFHPFNMGGFLGYWLAPRLKTFIDGRMDHYPSEVLDDYLRMRRASQAGAMRMLSELLEKWQVDVFFGTGFPESRYSERTWTAHLRRLPGWVPVFVSQTHSIFLRKVPRNSRNFALVKAYYLQRNVPFDPERGVDVSAAIRRRPGWAVSQGIVPAHYARLLAEREGSDPERRRAALAELGELYGRVGAFADGVEVDRELAALDPQALEPRRRLADGLLQLGRAAEALAVAEELHARDPAYGDVEILLALARQRAGSPEGAAAESPADPPAEGPPASPTSGTSRPSRTSASDTSTRRSTPSSRTR